MNSILKIMTPNMTRGLLIAGILFYSLGLAAQQRSIDMELIIDEPASGTYESGQVVPLSVSIINHGPDEIKVGDSLFVLLPDGAVTYGIMTVAVPVGGSTDLFSDTLPLPDVEDVTTIDVCVQLVHNPSSTIRNSDGDPILVSYDDPNPTNNLPCHEITIEPDPTSVMDAYAERQLNIFPNPATNFVQIPVSKSAKGQTIVSIRDLLGRIVMDKQFPAQSQQEYMQLDVSALQNGVYILERYDETEKVAQKLVIKR